MLSPPGLLPTVDPLLPAERPAIRLVYSSADEHLERIRQFTHPSLIVIASVSGYFLQMARAVLAPAVGRGGGPHSSDQERALLRWSLLGLFSS